MKLVIWSFLYLGLMFTGIPGAAMAQTYELDIRSDKLDIDNTAHHAIFRGNVVVIHDELTLKADKVDVYYNEEDGGRSVDKVEAEGHVVMEKGDRVATGERGVYRPGEEEMVLYENVTVRQGDDQTLRGTKMHYDMAKGLVKLSSESNRVRARLGAKGTGKDPEDK